MNKAIEFASATKVHAHDLLKVSDTDGWNMFHAAVAYKRVDIINKFFEYGTGKIAWLHKTEGNGMHSCHHIEIIHDPVEDKLEDTPLILAIKYFTTFLDRLNLTDGKSTNLEVVKLLLDFGKLKTL